MLVNKQWSLATNNPEVAQRLYRPCPGKHEHIPVLHEDVKASENYSPGFALHVQDALAHMSNNGGAEHESMAMPSPDEIADISRNFEGISRPRVSLALISNFS